MSTVSQSSQRLHSRSVRFSIKRLLGYERAWPVHTYLASHPRVFGALVRGLGRGNGGMVTPQTSLVIAGIGGCSNTFAATNIQHSHPDMHVASHWHIPALAIEAARLNIPCLTLVRHPVDAITSLTSRGGMELSERGLIWALKDYAFFYRTVLPYRNQYVAAHFDEVTRSFPTTIKRLNRHFGTNFKTPDTDTVKNLVSKNHWRDENRLYSPKQIRREIMDPALEELRRDAESVYAEFCDLTGIDG